MKVHVELEGGDGTYTDYDLLPDVAAIQFVDDLCAQGEIGPGKTVNVCVTPADEEARALSGWQADDDDPQVRFFHVTARVTWDAREVSSFNSAHEGDP